MSDQDKINAIINAIQTDATLMSLIRLIITNNIVNIPGAQLTAMCDALGIVIT